MVGAWSEHAETFLIVFAIVGGVAFALPLFLTPLAWARVFRWSIPDDTDLSVYFGRCLGALAVVLGVMAMRAGLTGVGLEVIYQFLIGAFALMTLVHIWGAIRRIQPITETIEIAWWAALLVLALLFYPA